jgi:hypothetical protein
MTDTINQEPSRTEGESDALEIAEDIALLEGSELIYLSER